MIDVVAALIPVFAIIALGAVLRRLDFLPEEGWRTVERVTYFVLFPCFLFAAIAFADFSDEPLGRLSLLLAGAMIVMAALVYPFRSLAKLDGPAFTSVFQGAVRWNSYVALGAIAANGETGFAMLVRQLARNPLIIACAAGIVVQIVGLPIPKVAATTVDMVGKAALPLGLLAVGASLDLGHARARPEPIVVATVLKLLVMPLLVAAGATALGIDSTAKMAALICAAVPGASSSYILARQLGGDAPLMANITTAQTLAAMVTMPIMLWVLA
jgi:malonate transporter and related proteins